MLPEMITLSESYIQVWERQAHEDARVQAALRGSSSGRQDGPSTTIRASFTTSRRLALPFALAITTGREVQGTERDPEDPRGQHTTHHVTPRSHSW